MGVDSIMYGFINLDWNKKWTDKNGARINDAKFSVNNIYGEYTILNTPGKDNSGNSLPISENFYNGILKEAYIYDSKGEKIIFTVGNNIFNPYINYYNYNYGMYSTNSSSKYYYPNYDKIDITNLIVQDFNTGVKNNVNFNVQTPIYNTEYDYALSYNIKNKGIELPINSIKIVSQLDTTSNLAYNFEYTLYYGSGVIIPENLRNLFNIDLNDSYNPFTNKNSFGAIYDNINDFNDIYYWQNYSNNIITPQNTGWVISRVIGTLK